MARRRPLRVEGAVQQLEGAAHGRAQIRARCRSRRTAVVARGSEDLAATRVERLRGAAKMSSAPIVANGEPAKASPTVSLVLGSGGARGYAHIGAIEELVAQGYDIRSVAGASMGALVGG